MKNAAGPYGCMIYSFLAFFDDPERKFKSHHEAIRIYFGLTKEEYIEAKGYDVDC